jgi:hypothetical protein
MRHQATALITQASTLQAVLAGVDTSVELRRGNFSSARGVSRPARVESD